MSTVAKVFIVLNLVFAVIYVGVSAALLAKQENWYHKYHDKNDEFTKAQDQWDTKSEDLVSQLQQRSGENDSLRSEVKRLGDDNKMLREERQATEDKWQQIRSEVQKLREQYLILGKELEDQRKDNRQLASENDTIRQERDEAVRVREQTTDDNARLNRDLKDLKVILDDLESRHIELAKRNRENENIIQNYLSKLKLRIPGALVKAPSIHGKVVGVSNKFNLVMLNVGDGDQVKPGYEFTIYRGSTYVGRVKVDNVYPDMCSCISLAEYAKGEIKKGDEASTRIQ